MDDNKVIRQLIRVNLELEGFEVVTAADGAECLEVVHQVRPDVVTLDVVMPRLDGLHTAARLRSDARTRGLPVVIVSACSPHEMDAGLGLGVDAFLAKPFEPAELVRTVRELARRGPRPEPVVEHPAEAEPPVVQLPRASPARDEASGPAPGTAPTGGDTEGEAEQTSGRRGP